jgi:chromosome segregation ATPase
MPVLARRGAELRTKVSISDALQAFITQLSDQLQNEAATAVDAIRAEMVEQHTAHERVRVGLEAQLISARDQLEAVSRQLESSQRELAGLKDQLGDEKIARHTAEQRSLDLRERLADAERHQASLEEKHRHARDALEHYRVASKEQREQENRRHEQQVQALQAELRQAQLVSSIKQEELTRLNKEAAALGTELRANKQAVHDEREAGRTFERKLEQLHAVEQRVAAPDAQLAPALPANASAATTA